MVITPSSQGEDRIRKVTAAVDQAAKAVAAKRPSVPDNATALPKAKLQVLSGAFAGRELELTKALTTLGRPASRSRRSPAVPKAISSCTSTVVRKMTIRRSTAYRSDHKRVV